LYNQDLQIRELEYKVSEYEKQKKLVENNTQTEFGKLKSKLSKMGKDNEMLSAQNKELLDKYTESLCKQRGIKLDTVKTRLPKNYTISDVDRIVSELADRNLRFSKLPIAQPRTRTVRLAESIGLSEEDAQTMELLKSVKKTH
jgi:hypothetical protein